MQKNEKSMLGNLGYSTVNCASMPIEVGAVSISCTYGVIGAIYQLGVSTPGDGNPLD